MQYLRERHGTCCPVSHSRVEVACSRANDAGFVPGSRCTVEDTPVMRSTAGLSRTLLEPLAALWVSNTSPCASMPSRPASRDKAPRKNRCTAIAKRKQSKRCPQVAARAPRQIRRFGCVAASCCMHSDRKRYAHGALVSALGAKHCLYISEQSRLGRWYLGVVVLASPVSCCCFPRPSLTKF